VRDILKSFVLIFLLGTFCIHNAEGKGKNLPNYTIGEGLSNNSVTAIFQDSFGFLWIGTEDGLDRYDGYKFTTYRHNPSDEYSISGNHIQVIIQDNQKNLWIGTKNSGLSKLDYETGHFTSYLANANAPNSLPENGVYGLLVDNRGNLWVKTQTYLSLFRNDSLGFENYGHFNNVFNVEEVLKYPLITESDTSILVGTKDGLNRFNTSTKRFMRFDCLPSKGVSSQKAVFDILPFRNHKYLIGTSAGLKLLNFRSNGHIDVVDSNITGRTVNSIVPLDNGDVLVGTNHGLEFFNPESASPRSYKAGQKPIVKFNITALFQDRSGIVWIGTRFNGLLKLNLAPPKFQSLSDDLWDKEDVKSFNFQSVFQDNEGNLWLGTIDSGIYGFNPYKKQFHHYIIKGYNDANPNTVYVLHKDESGKLWAGTNCGLYYYRPSIDRFVEFENGLEFGVDNLLKSNSIFAMESDFDGNQWIGTGFGLYRYDGRNIFSYFHEEQDSSGLLSDKINALCIDEAGNLWIGTSAGLNVWDRQLNQMHALSFEGVSGLSPGVSVLSLTLSYNGKIWIGTRSGLWEAESPDKNPVLMPGSPNLPNSMIKAVVSDDTNRAWVSTNKGIACLNPDGTVYHFDIVDGLPGYVFNNNSVFKNRSGTLFFGGTDGLCWFHPDSINYNLTRPPLAITNIEVVRKGEKTDSYWSQCKSIEMKYRPFTSVNIEFSALEFTQPSKNRYKVFLKGYDQDWRPVTYNNKVSFSNLLPGEYILKIIASNNDFTWNNEPYELNIFVTPPLWMSNYAFAFYILAVIFIIHLFINYRVRHYRKANKELQEKNVNKKQIEAQREVLTSINRSLTDSINYARRIQKAMIPSEKTFSRIFPESFIYLRARDIVSGDFFWYHEKEDKVFVSAVDCTGHGVPGAFMSIIGIDLLKNIVEVQGLELPSDILKSMNEELVRTLHKEQPSGSVDGYINDGMDMSLLVIDRKKNILDFSGAYNGFYLIRDNEIHSYKGNRFPVGYLRDGESPVFTRKEIQLQKDDVIYLFSDGLPDQFGGPDHKKFKYRRFRLLLLNIHKMGFGDQKRIIHQKIEEWMDGENEQVDDMLVIGFKPIG
jgi:ligand-binding sensor domain-containing protein/serine phosphatase RsbU (regulator of sigma subunit)